VAQKQKVMVIAWSNTRTPAFQKPTIIRVSTAQRKNPTPNDKNELLAIERPQSFIRGYGHTQTQYVLQVVITGVRRISGIIPWNRARKRY
jgi:hypothetical protein